MDRRITAHFGIETGKSNTVNRIASPSLPDYALYLRISAWIMAFADTISRKSWDEFTPVLKKFVMKQGAGRMPGLTIAQKLLPLLSLILIWPALLNGTAFIFPDTSAYIREADAAVYHLTGHATPWSEIIQNSPPELGHPGNASALPPKHQSSFLKNVLLGRSIYYGFFLYSGAFFDCLWIPIALQALIAGIIITGWSRHFVDPEADPRKFASTVIAVNVIAAFTSLPYYISMLMPDVFSGFLILVCALIATGWQRENRGWRLVWLALIIFGALAHSSNILILIVLAVAASLIAPLLRRSPPWAAIGMMVMAVLAGLAGDAAFKAAVHHTLGREPLRPPFLSARLMADGPGTAYLKESCPESHFAYCDYQDRITPYSDNILWSEQQDNGIFSAITPAMQVRISSEESRFVREVFLHHPIWTIQTILENAVEQSVSGGLSEFNLQYEPAQLAASKFPRNVAVDLLASRGQRGDMPTWFYHYYSWPLILMCLIVLGSTLFLPAYRHLRYPVTLMVAGVFANALICGAMSGAHERYQDRVIWLPIIWAAMIVVTSVKWSRYGVGRWPETAASN